MASKSSTAAKNVYTPLVMVSLGAWKTTLAGNTDFHGGSIDTNFYPPQFRLDSTFKPKFLQKVKITMAPNFFPQRPKLVDKFCQELATLFSFMFY
jgi:hypothetical protein